MAESLKSIKNQLVKQKQLHLMALPGLIFLLIFAYIPMFGLIIIFKEYNPVDGFLKSPFVGLAQFRELVGDSLFWNSFRNSFGMSLTKIGFSTILPIAFAVFVNEIRSVRFKKIVQTCSYLPYFISWVVVGGIFSMWLSSDGFINNVLKALGLIKEPAYFLGSSGSFWFLMAIIDAWKNTGWWAIIFIAAIAGIPQELYESAEMDGAGRFRKIISITLPCIKSTIIVVFILNFGSMLAGGLGGSNMNQSLIFGNALNYDSSMILDTYSIEMGFKLGRFSYAAAAGAIQSALSLIMFFAANMGSRKYFKSSLY